MFEDFGGFWKKKQERKPSLPKSVSPEDVHDDHADQVMFHLTQIQNLTHPDSIWHKAIAKMGGSSTKINKLHKEVTNQISHYGE